MLQNIERRLLPYVAEAKPFRRLMKLGRAIKYYNYPMKALSAAYWDRSYYGEVTDESAMGRDPVPVCLHYASVELIIARFFAGNGLPAKQPRVLDLGSGPGHWIEFYRRLGSRHIVGIEIAPTVAKHLQARFATMPVRIECGDVTEVMRREAQPVDIVNAIGVMFHIIDDKQWESTIEQAARLLKPGGVFIVGGYFGWFNMNAQRGLDNLIDKRLRSSLRWKATLRRYGFAKIAIQRNSAHRYSDVSLPENNILFAIKG
jgi:SAM-dependent methyltransferase